MSDIDSLFIDHYKNGPLRPGLRRLEDAQLDRDRVKWALRWAEAFTRREPEAENLRKDQCEVSRLLKRLIDLCKKLSSGTGRKELCVRFIQKQFKSAEKTKHRILNIFAVCIPMDFAATFVASAEVNRNSRERLWYSVSHAERMRKAQAIPQTCKNRHSMNPLYLLLAEALEIERQHEELAIFLKPHCRPFLESTPPDDVLKACGLPIRAARGHKERITAILGSVKALDHMRRTLTG
jgi:hypothetical protein